MMTRCNTLFRQALVVSALFATLSPAHAAPPNLGAGIWTITAVDLGGLSWSNSTITFESQVQNGADFAVSGHFYWVGSNGAYGRENFVGTLFANNHIIMTGTAVVQPSVGVVTASYSADVTADGTHMVHGVWGGAGTVPSDDWTAVQTVPEPGQWALLLMGGLLVQRLARAKRAQA